MLWLVYRLPSKIELEEPTSTTSQACFTGLARKIQTLRLNQSGYFPQGEFSADPQEDTFAATRYSKSLMAMNEPSLIGSSDSQDAHFRFLWLPSLRAPTVISLSHVDAAHANENCYRPLL